MNTAPFFHQNEDTLSEKNFFYCVPEENRTSIKNHFHSLTPSNPHITYTQQVIATDGDPHWQQWTGRALFDNTGQIAEYQALGKDVTDEILAQNQKAALENELQEAQRMEAIGTLAGGIAHDFNNILGGIIGYTELVQMDVPADTRTQHYLGQILKACHRAKDLIIQILTFSRQSTAERQPLELSSIVKEALKLLRVTLPNGIDIQYEQGSAPAAIKANPTQIHQMLMNLCTNAISAMHQAGGILKVDIDEIAVTTDNAAFYPELETGVYVKLLISDTGPGIREEVLQRIFDPYFTTKAPYEGTGLGLSLCLGIVKDHGGTISVKSTPEQGSAFTILLPKIEHSVYGHDDHPLLDFSEVYGNERILFVDDDAFLAEVGKEMLHKFGYTVVTSINSLEALDIFRAQPNQFDLVITDHKMPDMTGAQLATKILDLNPDMPIIMCTGFSDDITEEQAKALGIRKFFLKPVSRQDMVRSIREVIGSQE